MQAIKRRREKLLLAIISLWCISFDIYGQQPYGLPTYNTSKPLAFEKQWSTKAPGITSENIQLKGIAEVQETTTYMDGYGRPIQSVAKKRLLPQMGAALWILQVLQILLHQWFMMLWEGTHTD
ncbi:DUF6443 domain-containing protein [Niabella hibiscisoli]|uniref:DUF6443 domain-containing protein n=1 Tax=Niabella hibiscisoli TaxID=1825928 RepID=UPI001F0F33D8|nr:hypothetical protein [Niabella hibiscisoli]MCH5718623.1 hypothetical protein [Niabella hibiscisoli]